MYAKVQSYNNLHTIEAWRKKGKANGFQVERTLEWANNGVAHTTRLVHQVGPQIYPSCISLEANLPSGQVVEWTTIVLFII